MTEIGSATATTTTVPAAITASFGTNIACAGVGATTFAAAVTVTASNGVDWTAFSPALPLALVDALNGLPNTTTVGVNGTITGNKTIDIFNGFFNTDNGFIYTYNGTNKIVIGSSNGFFSEHPKSLLQAALQHTGGSE